VVLSSRLGLRPLVSSLLSMTVASIDDFNSFLTVLVFKDGGGIDAYMHESEKLSWSSATAGEERRGEEAPSWLFEGQAM
jgi:hypothetical protein